MAEVEQKVRDKFIKKDDETEQQDGEKDNTVSVEEESAGIEETDINEAVTTEKADE